MKTSKRSSNLLDDFFAAADQVLAGVEAAPADAASPRSKGSNPPPAPSSRGPAGDHGKSTPPPRGKASVPPPPSARRASSAGRSSPPPPSKRSKSAPPPPPTRGRLSAPPAPRRPSVHDVPTSPGDVAIDVEFEQASPAESTSPDPIPALVAENEIQPGPAADAAIVGAPSLSVESSPAEGPPVEGGGPILTPVEPLSASAPQDEPKGGELEKAAADSGVDEAAAAPSLSPSIVPRPPRFGSNDVPTSPGPFDVVSDAAASPAPAVDVPLLSIETPRKRSLPPPPPSARLALAPAMVPAPIDSAALDAGWDLAGGSGEDLTRQLPDIVPSRIESADVDLTRPLLHALPDIVPSRIESSLSDVDVTSPLPPPAAPAPYGSDMDLTRPMPPSVDEEKVLPVAGHAPPAGRRPMPKIPRLRPVPTIPPPPPAPPERALVPVIVAVPPPSVGVLEHPPSIQISATAQRRSVPTLPPAPRRSTPPPPPAYGHGDALDTMPRIPPPAPLPSNLGGRPMRSSIAPTAGSVPPPPLNKSRRLMVALAAVTFGVGALALALRSRTGSLIVTVSGADGEPVRGVSIRVDGVERCTASPCRLGDLALGAHLVSATAAGLPASAERAVAVESSEVAAEHVTLKGARRLSLSGLGVSAIGDALHVFVDGRDLGAPPVSLRDVEPGSHTVRVVGTEGLYEPYEENIQLEGGEVRSLGPVRLHLLKGRLRLTAGNGADGANIAVDGHRVAHLPAVLNLSPDEAHEITATKRGFSDLTDQVVFDGVAERSVVVSLEPGAGGSPEQAVRPASANAQPRGASFARKASAAAPAPAQATGVSTLDINSVPRSNVVLNGRPLGSTPLSGIKVTPGPQTIVFIHPKLGRKVASANVAPGHHAAASVKF
jgi:hypothetical protein